MSVESKAAWVLGDETDDDMFRLEVQSPRGDFTLEFTTTGTDAPLWNVCNDPPTTLDSEEYVILDSGRNFYLLGSGADYAAAVAREARDLVVRIGGPDARIYKATTRSRWTGPPWWLTARGWATRGHDLLAGGES